MSIFKIWFECIAECLSVVTRRKLEVINMNDYIHVDDYETIVKTYQDHLAMMSHEAWNDMVRINNLNRSLNVATTRDTIGSFILVLSIVANIVLAVFLANP